MTPKTALAYGALVGALLTAPLTAISALAHHLLGFSFVPFDIFAFLVNILPGAFLTNSISLMVNVLNALNVGRVDSAAKIAEQAIAIITLNLIGIVISAAYFAFRARQYPANEAPSGQSVGLMLGAVLALISATTGSTITGVHLLSAAFVIVLFALWGKCLHWAYRNLADAQPV